MDITYNFVDPVSTHNAGHVYGITNNLNSKRSQVFTYDQVNRITSAGTTDTTTAATCWGNKYSYDAWANLLSQAAWTPTYNACVESTMGTMIVDGNNHVTTGLTYDTSGNTLTDGVNTYTWNGESQLKTAAGVTYSYDGDGRRAAKVGSKLYWYGSGGEILAETNAAGATLNDYVFFGGRRVALVPATGTAQYYAEDFLGSSRVITQSTGAVCYDADFTPFGAERTITNTCTQNAYKFEGKERDAETQNDDFGAREYSWRVGRWLSSDWSAVPVAVPYANLTNPQTLNLYSMVGDDPESFADLDGHYEVNPSGCNTHTKCQKKYNKAADRFEKARQKDLKSKDARVRAAAAKYGDRGAKDGVHVSLRDLHGTGIKGSVDGRSNDGKGKLIDVEVTIDSSLRGKSLQETVAHEGAHVGDDVNFLTSYDFGTGKYDSAENFIGRQTEFHGYQAGAGVSGEHGFGPNDTQKINDYISDHYDQNYLNNNYFPDNANFPQ